MADAPATAAADSLLAASVDSLRLAVDAIDKHFLSRLRDASSSSSSSSSTAPAPVKQPQKPQLQLLPTLSQTRPTLAHLARFHKLQRLRDGLAKLGDVCQRLGDWRRQRHVEVGGSLELKLDEFAGQCQLLTSQIRDMWSTKKAALDAAYCLQYARALEFKIAELHKLCARLIGCCFDLLLAAKRAGVGRLPIAQEALMEIAETMPEEYMA